MPEALRSLPPSRDTVAYGIGRLQSLAEALSSRGPDRSKRTVAFRLRESALALLAHAVEVENHHRGADLSLPSPFEAYGEMLVATGLQGGYAIAMLHAAPGQSIVKELLPHGIRSYGRMLLRVKVPTDAAIDLLKEHDAEGQPATLEACRNKDLAKIQAFAEVALELQFPTGAALALIDAEDVTASGLKQTRQERTLAALAFTRALLPLCKNLIASSPPMGLPDKPSPKCLGLALERRRNIVVAPRESVTTAEVLALFDSIHDLISSKIEGLPRDDQRRPKLQQSQNQVQLHLDALREERPEGTHAQHALSGVAYRIVGCLGEVFQAAQIPPHEAAERLQMPAYQGATILRVVMRTGHPGGLTRFGRILKECRVPHDAAASLLNSESDGLPPPLLESYEREDLPMIRAFAGVLEDLAFPAGMALSLLDIESVPLRVKPRLAPQFASQVQQLRIELFGSLCDGPSQLHAES